jgi:hypothetical protein
MRQATLIWSLWQRLLQPFAPAFTRPGYRRFVEWATALVLNVEEHTITRSVVAIERVADWKALESFAEYGAWKPAALARILSHQSERAPGRVWHGYHVSALDDTKVHRSGEHVWGTCTFPDSTARCPNRATTVRAHNWVALGALLDNPGPPAWYLPVSGRLCFRKSQLPERPQAPGKTEPFRTQCELAVELLREQAGIVKGAHLGVFDGGSALRNVVRPRVMPEDGSPRVEILTRLRHDARLYALPPTQRQKGQRGPLPKWGKKLPPPRQGGRWTRTWQSGHAFLSGRMRKVLWKEVVCLWRVLGHDVPVKAVVAKVEGSKNRFTLVSSAMILTGLQMVELFCARFRQEDGFRDLKQRLGWEECRAWTRAPIERTTPVQWVTMSLLRLLQFRLDAEGVPDWWSAPPWNKKKDRPSVLDVERLLRRHRPEIQRHLSAWLGDEEEAA